MKKNSKKLLDLNSTIYYKDLSNLDNNLILLVDKNHLFRLRNTLDLATNKGYTKNYIINTLLTHQLVLQEGEMIRVLVLHLKYLFDDYSQENIITFKHCILI